MNIGTFSPDGAENDNGVRGNDELSLQLLKKLTVLFVWIVTVRLLTSNLTTAFHAGLQFTVRGERIGRIRRIG